MVCSLLLQYCSNAIWSTHHKITVCAWQEVEGYTSINVSYIDWCIIHRMMYYTSIEPKAPTWRTWSKLVEVGESWDEGDQCPLQGLSLDWRHKHHLVSHTADSSAQLVLVYIVHVYQYCIFKLMLSLLEKVNIGKLPFTLHKQNWVVAWPNLNKFACH